MTKPLAETSPSTRGRILAALYLVVIIGGITAQAFISDRLVVRDDAAKTATNILANTSLYRLGFTIFMLEMVAQVGVSAMYYDLLKRRQTGNWGLSLVVRRSAEPPPSAGIQEKVQWSLLGQVDRQTLAVRSPQWKGHQCGAITLGLKLTRVLGK